MEITDKITIHTDISIGYRTLIDAFIKANNLDMEITTNGAKIYLTYVKDSDTDLQVSFMSLRHLGFNNMLFDYLIKCGIPADFIPFGQIRGKSATDAGMYEHFRKIGIYK